MATETVTVSINTDAVEHLDRLAHMQHTDRNTLINRAVERYLLPEFSEEDVLEGLREADSDQLSPLADVMERAKAWNR